MAFVTIPRHLVVQSTNNSKHAACAPFGQCGISRAWQTSDEIPWRAVVVAQAELKVTHDAPSAPFLREMSLTLMAAASRLRFLTALRTRESGR